MDYDERENGNIDSEKCENGKPKCCYDSKSSYESLPEDASSVCPPEPFCCHPKPGQDCPVLDYGVRHDDITNNDGKCCFDSRSDYDDIPDVQSVCPVEPQFCCYLKPGQDCPVPDFGVRNDDFTNLNERCCYDSRSDYDAIPDAQSVCTVEPKFCCHLKPGQQCPVPDFGVRNDDITNNEVDVDGACCYESRAEYEAIPDIQSVCPAELKKCCCLREGSECPVEDLDVREDLLVEDSCPDGKAPCCHYTQSFFNNIIDGRQCKQTYKTVSKIHARVL